MPFTYEHIEEVLLDGTQRGLFNSFVASTWSGNPGDVTNALMRIQTGNTTVVEVTGTRSYANENALPDPPIDIVSTDGTAFVVQKTDRGSLNPGQQNHMENFIAAVWPGAVADVIQMDFLRVLDESQTWQMRATLRGNLTAATSDDLPKGQRFKMKTKT